MTRDEGADGSASAEIPPASPSGSDDSEPISKSQPLGRQPLGLLITPGAVARLPSVPTAVLGKMQRAKARPPPDIKPLRPAQTGDLAPVSRPSLAVLAKVEAQNALTRAIDTDELKAEVHFTEKGKSKGKGKGGDGGKGKVLDATLFRLQEAQERRRQLASAA